MQNKSLAHMIGDKELELKRLKALKSAVDLLRQSSVMDSTIVSEWIQAKLASEEDE